MHSRIVHFFCADAIIVSSIILNTTNSFFILIIIEFVDKDTNFVDIHQIF